MTFVSCCDGNCDCTTGNYTHTHTHAHAHTHTSIQYQSASAVQHCLSNLSTFDTVATRHNSIRISATSLV